MTFIIRWPLVLLILFLVIVCLGAAAATTAIRLDAPVDLSFLSEDQVETIRSASWLEVGLWAGAAIFFFVAAVRLGRRTQAFWAWLIAFALYGGRWAVAQQAEGGLVAATQGLSVESFQPEALAAAPDAPAAQISVLGVILIVGLLLFVIDAADRSYWDRQEA